MPSTASHPSILVVLENELVRCGVFSLLRSVPSVHQVWSCSGPVAARELLARHRPDIVLCHGSGELAPQLVLAAEDFDARVLLLLQDLRLEAIDEGVMPASQGFLMQGDLTAANLHEAVTKLNHGEMPLPTGSAYRAAVWCPSRPNSASRRPPACRARG